MTPSAMPPSEAARYEVMVREVRRLWDQARRDAAEIAALRAALGLHPAAAKVVRDE